jgi:hypothetical protein
MASSEAAATAIVHGRCLALNVAIPVTGCAAVVGVVIAAVVLRDPTVVVAVVAVRVSRRGCRKHHRQAGGEHDERGDETANTVGQHLSSLGFEVRVTPADLL